MLQYKSDVFGYVYFLLEKFAVRLHDTEEKAHPELPVSRESEDKKGGFSMKVRSSVKPICEKCKIIKRKGSIRVICEKSKTQTETGLMRLAESLPVFQTYFVRLQ